ncbi:hypothetical protein JQC72_06745 [Polycladomyces sp. WAk]|uniref:Uncharacterized protein n=1 Tax=Polycladomyces zharkentensis TaxID=2807616 RepID=A0ABS2WI71_9BACL|nr:hypothetical protein [Polycladomyces sp. WAk]MBN2909219.1 hypothetical protein [Polycladomyces sp. WAk]
MLRSSELPASCAPALVIVFAGTVERTGKSCLWTLNIHATSGQQGVASVFTYPDNPREGDSGKAVFRPAIQMPQAYSYGRHGLSDSHLCKRCMEKTKEKPKNVKKGAGKRKGFVYPEKPVHDRIRKANVCVGQEPMMIGLHIF